MANTYILKKREDFTFALESNPKKIYTIPALKSMSFEDAEEMVKIDEESDIAKKGEKIKTFILKYAPELAEDGIGEMEYFDIFNAYGLNQGAAMGES